MGGYRREGLRAWSHRRSADRGDPKHQDGRREVAGHRTVERRGHRHCLRTGYHGARFEGGDCEV